MSDTNSDAPGLAPTGNGGAEDANGPHIQVIGQYIKDLSFENPNAPMSLRGPGENPKMNVEVNVNARKVGDDTYESVIHFNAKASNDTGAMYELEIAFAGLCALSNVPDNMIQPILLINCPTLTFPFLRRLVADLTREGGFPPLTLDPIDFSGLYAQNLQKQSAEGDAAKAS